MFTEERVDRMVMWLNSYRHNEQEISSIDIELVSAKLEYFRWKDGDLSKDHPYDVSLNKQRELLEYIDMKRDSINKLLQQQRHIEKTVDKFDGVLNLIAKEKYIKGKTIPEIAEENNYTSQYLYNKHAEIKRIINYGATNKT